MDDILISVITPSLNPDINKIKITLDNILKNRTKFELVLILQNTTEKKIQYLKKKYRNNKKLKIIADKGIGISRARNIGIKYSTGQWILLLDDDITLEVGIIKSLKESLCNEELFHYGNVFIRNSKKHYVPFFLINKNLNFWNYNRVSSVSLIINRKVFYSVGLFDENLGSGSRFGSSEESDLILRSLLKEIKIKYLKIYSVYHDKPKHSLNKIEYYAKGTGALYKKHLRCKNIKLYFKFFLDIILRILFLISFKKKRYLFFKGFFLGFIGYKK